MDDDMSIIIAGLQRYPWNSDRVRQWRLRAEEVYIAPYNYDPEQTDFPPPWDSPMDAPPEALGALANIFRKLLGESSG